MKFQRINILLLRYKQAIRISYQLGILRVLLIFSTIVVLIAMTYILISTEKNIYPVVLLYLLTNLMIHLRRKDKKFLIINVSHFRIIFLAEYLILLSPLIICLLLYNKWLVLLFVTISVLFIPAIDCNLNIHHRKTFNTSLQKLIPSDLYEWKAGIRKNFILLLIAYILGACFSWNIPVIPITMLIIGLTISDFFIAEESWQMLLSFEKNAGKMLLYKIRRHFLFYAICNLPLIILFVIFHYDLWYIPIIEFIMLLSIHIYTITMKFAYYEADKSGRVNSIIQLIGVVLGLIPVTTPFLLLFSGFLFKKACTNLKPLLHDFN